MPKPSELNQLRDIPQEEEKTESVVRDKKNSNCAKWVKYKQKSEIRTETDCNFEFPDGGWVCS